MKGEGQGDDQTKYDRLHFSERGVRGPSIIERDPSSLSKKGDTAVFTIQIVQTE